MALLEKLKAKLAAEGLFDGRRKKPLPFLPRVIGVVTSPTGAVIRDILHRLEDRCPTHVLVWPVKVQGDGAAAEVAAAIARLRRDRARRPGAAPRSGDRRARRRLDRGSLVLQRGGRRSRDRRLLDPDHLGGRARDRHDACRLRRRPARADPDRRGGDGGAGARRPAADAGTAMASGPNAAPAAITNARANGWRRWSGCCRAATPCSGRSASAPTIWAHGSIAGWRGG